MKLGHLIRKWRHKLNFFGTDDTRIDMPGDELMRLLNAADTGLYLSVASGDEAKKLRDKLNLAERDFNHLVGARDRLRALYLVDQAKIAQLGFKDIDSVVGWFENNCINTGSTEPTVPNPTVPESDPEPEDLPF